MLRRTSIAFLILAALATPGILLADPIRSRVDRPGDWYRSEEGQRNVDNILTWQGHGPMGVMGWPQAYDTAIPRPADGGGLEWNSIATIDNDATYSELRVLARAITLESPGER